ncbi:MAG: adenylyl-sulfate kinase [Candidatus Methylacidiphilales bacterium]
MDSAPASLADDRDIAVETPDQPVAALPVTTSTSSSPAVATDKRPPGWSYRNPPYSLLAPGEIPAFMHPATPELPGKDEEERLKIVIVGHVDHGKSTLIGRLFYDTHSLPDGKVEAIQKACDAEGMEFEFAFLLDALLEEQAQNITIDTTQIQFRTERRNYVIIDAPGHKEFLKNMITGAASADAAILLIDANEGVQEQSRRHGYLLSLLGIKQVLVAVNKMDLVNFSQEVFDNLKREYTAFLKPLGVEPLHFIPISAKHGHNIIKPSESQSWFSGPSILGALDGITQPPSKDHLPLRFILQDVYRFDERRILAGRIESGKLAVGDEIVLWPNRKRSKVKSIEAWGARVAPTEATAGQSVAITMTEQIFAERGQVATHLHEPMVESREFQANLFWLHDEPLRMGQPYEMRLATQQVEARIVKITRVIDSASLESANVERTQVGKNEAAQVTLRTRRPLAFDNADVITETGRFVLLQNNRIGGGGIIHGETYAAVNAPETASDNITWSEGEVTAEARVEHFGHRGAILWLTGLSGSGKSTLSVALESALFRKGISAFILDGDNLRHGLCSNLGFSKEDRTENIRRAAEAARLLAEAGSVVIVALISPYREERLKAAGIADNAGVPFAEVFVNAPLAACEKRDPKHLYERARRGEIKGFTGIDSPYEEPEKPILELRTDLITKEECLAQLLELAVKLSKPDSQYRAEDIEPGANI